MEEKNNRIVEVMISTVKPFQLMTGKIVGIGMVGFCQFIIWISLMWVASLVTGLVYGSELASLQNNSLLEASNGFEAQEFSFQLLSTLGEMNYLRLIFSLLFYFFFGYVFYASQYAAIAAASNEESDTQTLALPITFPIIISLFLMMAVIEEPYSRIAILFSYIPFSSPIIMLSRIPFGVSWTEQILSMLILVISCFIVVWLSAKIYKTGILIQGKKITLKEIFTWFFYKS